MRSIRFIRVAVLGVLALATAACSSAQPSVSSQPVTSSVAPQDGGLPAPTENFRPGEFVLDQIEGYVFGGGGYFITLQPDGTNLATFSASTGEVISQVYAPPATNLSCGLKIVSTSQDQLPVFVGSQQETVPAQGLPSGSVNQTITAFSAIYASPLWTAVVDSAENTGQVPTDPCMSENGRLDTTFRVTSDGQFGLSTFGDLPVVVNLATGETAEVPSALSVLGRWIVVGNGGGTTPANLPLSVSLVDPATSGVVAETSDPDLVRTLTWDASNPADGRVVASSDDRFAVADIPYSGSGSDLGGIAGYSLPNLDPVWDLTYEESQRSFVFVGDGKVVALPENEDHTRYGAITALDIASGSQIWASEVVTERCALYENVVAVIANSQLVLVSGQDGEQLAFDPAVTSCPRQTGGGLVTPGSVGVRVMSLGSPVQ